jgi:DNA polymerase
MTENRGRLRRVVLGRLESLERAGVQQLPKAQPRAAIERSPAITAAPVEVIQTMPQPVVAIAPVISPPVISIEPPKEAKMARSSAWARGGAGLFEATDESSEPASSAATLAVLQQEVAPCTRCGELAATRTQTVFGVGNPKARLCFMGEAPGADEDRLGEPFVGRGGQLLNKIIEACRLKREDVYILNMLKCRPPGNRNPLPDELTNCRPFLERQLELIEPEYICCLGAVASQNLLGVTTPIGKLRGKLHAYRGAKVVCTFHPAYLLRNPPAKKDCWDDMKFLMREMGVEL